MIVNIIKKTVPIWAKILLRQIILSTPSAKRKRNLYKMKLEEDKNKTKQLINMIYTDHELFVLNGPFKGMKYIDSSNGSQLLPKLVGSYEEPIHNWIYEIIKSNKYDIIVDVGCAEGYYAVGLARALSNDSNTKILAFDNDKEALMNAQILAKLNGLTEKICYYEKFDASIIAQTLEQNPSSNILIFMDVEGAELDLLNPKEELAILNCDVLVELHDCFCPGLTEKMIERFHNSHIIEIIVDYPWRVGNYLTNGGSVFNMEDVQFSLDERRPEAMRWMYAKAK